MTIHVQAGTVGIAGIQHKKLCANAVRSMDDLAVEDRFYLSDGYKRSVLEHMSLPQLLDTLLINATVYISPSYRDTGLTASYSFKPLSNLVYTRDQQVNNAGWLKLITCRSEGS